MRSQYRANSLTLAGTVAMGTGVMIGAGIFALTGQVAEQAGAAFPAAFLLAAVISAFSAYSYIKVTRKYPSAGGIGMILYRCYGASTVTGAAALLMAFSMVINESLVARTFGTYTLQLFEFAAPAWAVPALAVGLIAGAFLINVSGNQLIGTVSKVSAVLKIGGILAFAGAALWASGFDFEASASSAAGDVRLSGFLAGVALAVLAYKGFTTITNSGDEVEHPERNVGRAIMISLGICLVVYMLVAIAVAAALTVPEIVAARDYSLAQAARPALGPAGAYFTIGIAIVATVSGLLASIFAVSRMLAMLSEMQIIPHSHFGMSGDVQRHTLVYTVVTAAVFAALFDLSRIAALGAIFYLMMDIIVHRGVFRHLREDVRARSAILMTAIALDAIVLVALVVIKMSQDYLILIVALVAIALMFALERFYLQKRRDRWSPPDLRSGH